MAYATEHLYEALRQARLHKGLSQRELSIQSGVPQSHISKIESGSVDLRVSSLVALARTLDMELFLAPKTSIPAIHAITRLNSKLKDGDALRSPAYQLDEEDDD